MYILLLHHLREFLEAGLYLAACLLLIFNSTKLIAKDVSRDVEIQETAGVYHVKATVVIDAPVEHVRMVLTDFVHIYRLNPSIIESEVLAQDNDAVTHVRTRVLGCAGYFCQELERVEAVQKLPSGDLIAEIVPEKSEFRSGRTVWHLEASGERSKVVYESSMEPDFYIPPVVGKFMAIKSIRNEMAISFKNLERIASVLAERDWNTDFSLTNKYMHYEPPCGLAAR